MQKLTYVRKVPGYSPPSGVADDLIGAVWAYIMMAKYPGSLVFIAVRRAEEILRDFDE